ncbi:MAG: hypothetical protein IV112_08625 [Methyloversatilis discipulorum]|uniref:hypothetical protein n=1 Tax=Methyloversatilis discipulorum TaxID=1119528 RepID=UPI0026F10537|nr:hypothetical protein [Methyloversatilis discipulorum]MBT9516742.1 hypothetical protein [Methyloversatilis discipulorum]
MAIEEWQLAQFQFAAEQMCFRLSESPHELVCVQDGTYRQRWMIYAERMVEHVAMLHAMRDSGLLP